MKSKYKKDVFEAAMKDKKIKFKVNKSDGGLNSPQFSISWKQPASEDDTKLSSYEILSALKGDNDILIEVNSSLFNAPVSERETCAMNFLESVRDLGLDYRYRKGTSQASQSFISQLFGFNKNVQSHEILAYIPDKIWRTEGFYRVLPTYGARYYITREPVESSKILDDMSRMLDSEKLDYFKLTVFDSSIFSYMGLSSKTMTADDIKQALGL